MAFGLQCENTSLNVLVNLIPDFVTLLPCCQKCLNCSKMCNMCDGDPPKKACSVKKCVVIILIMHPNPQNSVSCFQGMSLALVEKYLRDFFFRYSVPPFGETGIVPHVLI